MMKKIIQTDNAPAPVGPYNQAIAHGNTLYVSGQIAIVPATGELIQTNIQAETQGGTYTTSKSPIHRNAWTQYILINHQSQFQRRGAHRRLDSQLN